MTDRVIVIHKYHRRSALRFVFGLTMGLINRLPFGRLISTVFLLILAFIIVRTATPNYDVPYFPFASCEKGVEPKGGVVGIAYDAGRAAKSLTTTPPTVDEVQASLEDLAGMAGEVFGSLERGLSGDEALMTPVEPDEEEAVPTSGCVPCPGTESVPVVDDEQGIRLAASAALRAGDWDAKIATAIAGAESGYNPKAENPSSSAKGMWQTMMSLHAGRYAPGESWSDPYANARVAYDIYKDQGWNAWTVYTSGAYKSHLPEAEKAVAGLGGSEVQTVSSTDSDPRVADSGTPTQEVALKAASYIRSEFGFGGSIGGSATSGHIEGSKHYSGLALDVMIGEDVALGRRIADYFAGPGYAAFGVENVIHDSEIYNEPQGWHSYSGSSPHITHVHIDFREGGGTGAVVPAAECLSAVAPMQGTRVGTYNILGTSHRPYNWKARIRGAAGLVETHGLTAVGFQEVQQNQYRALRDLLPHFEFWHPGKKPANSIAWDPRVWSVLDKRHVDVPYFARNQPMPVVQLQHRMTGRTFWWANVHHPANTRGPAEGKRAEGISRILNTFNRLGGDALYMGDMNERGDFFCQVRRAGFVASDPAAACGSSRKMGIDWVVARGLDFKGYNRVRSGYSDHPMVYTDLVLSGKVT